MAGSITGFCRYLCLVTVNRKLLYTIKELSFEFKSQGFIAVAFHPGLVTTDMGQCGIDKMKGADADLSAIEVLTPEQSAKSLINVFEKISVEDNGKFYNYDRNETVFGIF